MSDKYINNFWTRIFWW